MNAMDEDQLQRGRGRQDLKLAELKVIELSHGTQGLGCERVEVGGGKKSIKTLWRVQDASG